jgi:deoxyinosine 3'endonuclease (endonuclease V)
VVSALSFREQAVLALITRTPSIGHAATVESAQKLAEACCEKWGHEERTTIMDDAEAYPVCQRCGAVGRRHK